MSKAAVCVTIPAGAKLRALTVQGTGRRFRIEVEAEGQPFTWTGPAANEGDAFRNAAEAIAREFPMVHARHVRLVACIEVAP